MYPGRSNVITSFLVRKDKDRRVREGDVPIEAEVE